MRKHACSITSTDGGSVFSVHVVPRSRRNEIGGQHGEAIKIRVTAPPVEGAANEALVVLLSRQLGVPKGRIEIVSGSASHNKIVSVSGLTPLEVEQRLGLVQVASSR
jgi:uncharacterized protein (TIGR00251 family)